jgi:quercetin dioxygenase-like cupin family protein
MKGEIWLRLDDEKEVFIKEGDYLVQSGTAHAWVNKSEEWCRMLCVMLDAEKVTTKDGKVLEQFFTPN